MRKLDLPRNTYKIMSEQPDKEKSSALNEQTIASEIPLDLPPEDDDGLLSWEESVKHLGAP